jgi:hypothetical protein
MATKTDKSAKPAKIKVKAKTKSKKAKSSHAASETFVNLLQSPLVADLVAVAASAALATLAEKGLSSDKKKTASKAVKSAGKAAAAAIGARLTTEIAEIRKASKAK